MCVASNPLTIHRYLRLIIEQAALASVVAHHRSTSRWNRGIWKILGESCDGVEDMTSRHVKAKTFL